MKRQEYRSKIAADCDVFHSERLPMIHQKGGQPLGKSASQCCSQPHGQPTSIAFPIIVSGYDT